MAQSPILEMRGIHKHFPGVTALQNAGIRLFSGEVHALMGQNGAGKSTLIKALTGVETPDAGKIFLDGRIIKPDSVQEAQDLGIATVYQEVNLCPNLSVAENIFIGRFPMRGPCVDWHRVYAQAGAALRILNLSVDVTRSLSSYPVAVQQMVAIARALSMDAQVLILDEPTSSLDEQEVDQLFSALRQLKAKGIAILFVTHFLEQTYAISDRTTVLRNGELEGEYLANDLSRIQLISKMVGREIDEHLFDRPADVERQLASGTSIYLTASGLGRTGAMQPIDLEVRCGEVLGLGGLLGSGRTETARMLFGIDPADSGALTIDGKPAGIDSPNKAIAHGIAFCPEDRKTEGIVADLSIRENIVLALQAKLGVFCFLSAKKQRAIADSYIRQLGIKVADAEQPISQLSGGNQQKAMLARWLATEPKMLILDEPTRGIDVAAKIEIMDLVKEQCERGLAIVFISSEMSEVLRVSDQIAILRDRKKIGQVSGRDSTEQTVFHMIAGGAQ